MNVLCSVVSPTDSPMVHLTFSALAYSAFGFICRLFFYYFVFEIMEQCPFQFGSFSLICYFHKFWLGSPTTTHRNLTSSSLNDISDKPEKDQVSSVSCVCVFGARKVTKTNFYAARVHWIDLPVKTFITL